MLSAEISCPQSKSASGTRLLDPVRLRGHHLLCQAGYRGEGYSPEFVANMTAVLTHLGRNPETVVEVGDTKDVLCLGLGTVEPHHCEEKTVVARDREVLRRLDLQAGDRLTWSTVLNRVSKTFHPQDLTTLCSTCPWLPLGYCQEGLAELGRRG